jgi:hypothetical protein
MISRHPLFLGLFALAVFSFGLSVGHATAEPLRCGAPFGAGERSLGLGAAAPKACAAQPSIILAQRQRMQSRVPAGQEYYLQLPGQRQFNKFSSGQTIPNGDGLDCIQVDCPASFPADAICWNCVKQETAEPSGDSSG